MNSKLILSLMLLFMASPLIAQGATNTPSEKPISPEPKAAYYVAIPAGQRIGDAASVLAHSGCMQYRAPEINIVHCKLVVGASASLKSFAGHFDFMDKAGKSHRQDLNSSNSVPWSAGEILPQQFDLSLEDYEVVSVQWVLDGYTNGKGKYFGKEPRLGGSASEASDAIDTICTQRGYKKK